MSARRVLTEELAALARQFDYRRDTLAAHLGMTTRTLTRLFHRQFQCAPKVWLSGRRMEEAARLLAGGLSVKETAGFLGFQHASSFSREFKRHLGCAPKDYQNRQLATVDSSSISDSQREMSHLAMPSGL